MSRYSYQCQCCWRTWVCQSSGRKPTKADIARMVCKPCRDAYRQMSKNHEHDGVEWVPKKRDGKG